jgi:hypothetical protein
MDSFSEKQLRSLPHHNSVPFTDNVLTCQAKSLAGRCISPTAFVGIDTECLPPEFASVRYIAFGRALDASRCCAAALFDTSPPQRTANPWTCPYLPIGQDPMTFCGHFS